MSDTQSIQIEVEAGVLELSAVVASDVLDLDVIVRHGRSPLNRLLVLMVAILKFVQRMVHLMTPMIPKWGWLAPALDAMYR